MLRLIRQSEFTEGPWRNGMGVSWEIASFKPEGAADFSWRVAKARIDRDVPFSIYPGIDRVFMQLSGNGLDLEFEGGRVLQVHESFVPHAFACDVPLYCKLRNGPCFDLNLFTARGAYGAEPQVVQLEGLVEVALDGAEAVVFALEGTAELAGQDGAIILRQGDAAVVGASKKFIMCSSQKARVFVGILRRLG